MCRPTHIEGVDLNVCILCKVLQQRKCNHELEVCSNPAVHPRWNVKYYKNSGGISTFAGCGFCKFAMKSKISIPALSLEENPGWPGCCYPPAPRYYGWIPPQDWKVVALYQRLEIPVEVQKAMENWKAEKMREKSVPEKLTVDVIGGRSVQQPVPIPKSNGYLSMHPRSHSPSAMFVSARDHTPPRSSVSSKDSNSSGSPPSSTTSSRRRDRDFDLSPDRSNPSPTTPARSSSQEDARIVSRSGPPGVAHPRRNGSPMERISRDREAVTGKRRSNSDPKHQAPPPSSYAAPHEVQNQPRRERERERERERDSPTQTRFKQQSPLNSSSTLNSNHPYGNPSSPASSSMKRLVQVEAVPPPKRPVAPPASSNHPQYNGPSITSVMANMSLNGPSSSTLTRIQMEMAAKRGVIPPHVRRAGSVISASSGSSSSTNSSAREGTVVSDGFTDYLSDDSDFDLQRQAEIEAERAYEDALRKHEEMEFKQARESLARAMMNDIPPASGGYGRRTGMQMVSSGGSRIQV